jgi:hypothetical protein
MGPGVHDLKVLALSWLAPGAAPARRLRVRCCHHNGTAHPHCKARFSWGQFRLPWIVVKEQVLGC